ncbi:MAG: LamG domain-containing protein [Bryobacteraceae bacterium]
MDELAMENYALQLSDQAYVSMPGAFSRTANFTVEMWVQPTSVDPFSPSDTVPHGLQRHCELTVGSEGSLYFLLAQRGGLQLSSASTGPTALLDGDWHHIAVVRSAAGTSITIYMDGADLITATAQPASLSTSYPIQLGYSYLQGQSLVATYLSGGFDEVRMWSVALTSMQIQLFLGVVCHYEFLR